MKKYNHNYHQDRAKDQEDHEEEIDEPNHTNDQLSTFPTITFRRHRSHTDHNMSWHSPVIILLIKCKDGFNKPGPIEGLKNLS